MARVSKGNTLNSLVLQPGWTIEEDGFGLMTSRLTFVIGHGSGDDQSPLILSDAPKRGDSHPKDSRLQCHRSTATLGANGLAVIVSEYLGIADGNMTSPEVSGRGNMSTEPIASHPDFESTIAGTQASPKNGAIFNTTDGTFKVFGPVSPPASAGTNKLGVRSYLNPGFGVSGHFYTSDLAIARKIKDALGSSSGSGKFANIQLLGGLGSINSQTSDSWYGSWTTAEEVPQLLLTGMAVDFFGNLIKLSYDITYARWGWDTEIYQQDLSGVGG
jgi:hypothetical protein